eukprot:9922684-Lingulodinium_polyedra.AAC.1
MGGGWSLAVRRGHFGSKLRDRLRLFCTRPAVGSVALRAQASLAPPGPWPTISRSQRPRPVQRQTTAATSRLGRR